MQKLRHNPPVGKMRFDDFFDAVVIEMTVANWPWPDCHVWPVIAAPLATAGAHFTRGDEVIVFECLYQCRAQ